MQGKREIFYKILAFGVTGMYLKTERQLPLENFYLPFGGQLDPENRWVKLSKLIPWDVIEDKYAALFAKNNTGAPAKPVRMALGALLIKEKGGFSDEEVVEQIKENPYLQYFIGLPEFQKEAPFDPSMMVHFRKRLNAQIMKEINEIICLGQEVKKHESDNDNHDEDNSEGDLKENKNKGRLIIDATCAPADIRYPTDLSLLNEAREKLERMIDDLYAPLKGKMPKPRTYRRNARKDYLSEAKVRKHRKKSLRRAIGKQLRYIARDLRIIERLSNENGCGQLSPRQQREYQIIQELYQQQKLMYETRTHRIDNRIVSISQPYVRPIVRGKAAAETEFGAKIMVSLIDGFAFVDEISWNNFNEGTKLKEAIETFRLRTGHYPRVVHADAIFRTRANLEYCKQRGIRLSGPRLGRPKIKQLKAQKRLERMDSRIRNAIEGRFGVGKRRYGLGRIMARLQVTSETVIHLQFLVMNLERKLRLLFTHFWRSPFRLSKFFFSVPACVFQ